MAALALVGMASCSAEQSSDSPVTHLSGEQKAEEDICALINTAHNRVHIAVGVASETFLEEEQAWNLVIASPQAQELASHGQLDMLLSTKEDESGYEPFMQYLSLIIAKQMPIEVLFERGILSERIYRRYMDVGSDLAAKKEQFEHCVANENLQIGCGRSADRTLYPDEIVIVERLLNYINIGSTPQNPIDAIFSVSSDIDMNELGEHFTVMTKSANDALLAMAIMLRETFPGAPRNNQFDVHAKVAIASSMLAAGYRPNLKPAAENNHLTLAFPHITYPTGVNLCTVANERAPAFLKLQEFQSSAECFYTIATDPEVAMQAYLLLNFDNLNRFENFVYASVPFGPGRQGLLEFMNRPENQNAFAAISAHLNYYGATSEQYRFLIEKLVESSYDSDRFIALISAGESGSYVKKVMDNYIFLQNHQMLIKQMSGQ